MLFYDKTIGGTAIFATSKSTMTVFLTKTIFMIEIHVMSRPKYCAVVNNFAETERTMEALKKEGCINIGDQFNINLQKYIGQNENSEKAEIKSEVTIWI